MAAGDEIIAKGNIAHLEGCANEGYFVLSTPSYFPSLGDTYVVPFVLQAVAVKRLFPMWQFRTPEDTAEGRLPEAPGDLWRRDWDFAKSGKSAVIFQKLFRSEEPAKRSSQT